jgi:hypothetical protein
MKIWTTIGAATAALGLLAAAAPAAALTLAFNVSVTSGTGAFTPHSFVQTWELTAFQAVDVYGAEQFHTLEATASASQSPSYAAIQAASGLADFASSRMVAANYDAAPGVVVKGLGLYQLRNLITQYDDGSVHQQTMSENIALTLLVPVIGGGITEANLTDFILSLGPLAFESYGTSDHWDQYSQHTGTAARYKGTATLITAAPGAVPEPASWALMIAGFGLAGAALRRRQPAAV